MDTWTFAWAIRNLFAELLMPPGFLLLSIVFAALLFQKSPRLQKTIIAISAILIWVVSTPAFVQRLTRATDAWMHWPAPLVLKHDQQIIINKHSAAIVVLGGGRRKGAIESPQYQNQDLSASSLERLRIGARLAHETGLPMLVTGGAPDQTSSSDFPEAVVMARILDKEFKLQAKWLEAQSHTTQENAEFSAKLLKHDGITTIYLVTHFWHMPRAQRIFEKQELEVIPVPHGFHHSEKFNPTDFYPTSITETRQIWHEILGVLWYRLRY